VSESAGEVKPQLFVAELGDRGDQAIGEARRRF
jgi:hypothetical protein